MSDVTVEDAVEVRVRGDGDLEACVELTREIHAADAIRRGLPPAVDVVTSYTAAITLYEQEHWRRIGTITVALPDGTSVDEYVYVGPM